MNTFLVHRDRENLKHLIRACEHLKGLINIYIYICVLNWRVSLVFQPSILALSQNHRCSSCGAESLPFLNIYRLGSQPICVKQQCHAGGIMLIHHHVGVDWWIKIRVRKNTSIWSSFSKFGTSTHHKTLCSSFWPIASLWICVPNLGLEKNPVSFPLWIYQYRYVYVYVFFYIMNYLYIYI